MSRPVSSHHSKSPNIVINYARPQSRSIEKVNFRPTYQVKQENLQIPLSHKANNERTNYPPVHQKKFERQESTPILSYHKSEVSDNNTPVKRVQFER